MAMFGPTRKSLSAKWTKEGRSYTSAINDMVRFGLEHGWDKWKGEEPEDSRSPAMARRVLKFLREANRRGSVDEFRRDFPPAHAPFADGLSEKGTHIAHMVWLGDSEIAFVVGTAWTSIQGFVLDLESESLTAVEDLRGLAASHDRRYLARVSSDRISVSEGWGGPMIADLRLPRAWDDDEGLICDFDQLRVFPDGQRVVAACRDGVFLIDASDCRRIHPVADSNDPDWHPYSDMRHVALSPDGTLICVGDQDSMHRVLDGTGKEVGLVGLASSYAHHAAFSDDGAVLAMNSCHFYNGRHDCGPDGQGPRTQDGRISLRRAVRAVLYARRRDARLRKRRVARAVPFRRCLWLREGAEHDRRDGLAAPRRLFDFRHCDITQPERDGHRKLIRNAAHRGLGSDDPRPRSRSEQPTMWSAVAGSSGRARRPRSVGRPASTSVLTGSTDAHMPADLEPLPQTALRVGYARRSDSDDQSRVARRSASVLDTFRPSNPRSIHPSTPCPQPREPLPTDQEVRGSSPHGYATTQGPVLTEVGAGPFAFWAGSGR